MDTSATPGLGSPQTSFTPIATAPVEESKVRQEGGLSKRARTPPQNITADDVEMQNLKHTAENSVADKFADLSDAMGEFVQSILLTASLFFNADSPTGILSAYFWMFSLNTVLGTPTTQIISLVIATFFFSAVYAPLPTPGALGVPRPRKFNVQKHIVPFIIGSLAFHTMHHKKMLFFHVSLMSFFVLTIICFILL